MHRSGVAFGTSGARGLVAAMSDRVCHGYVTGFLQYLVKDGAWTPGGRVALAGDLRPSTPRILAACAQAVRDLGGEPVFCGFVPTPALALWAFGEGIPSMMVTGSHIPDDRNGIKFYRPDGEILKDDEPGIVRQLVGPGTGNWGQDGELIDAPALPAPIDVGRGYVARYINFFGAEALRGLRLGVYQHSAVGREILAEICAALGAEVVTLGRSDAFIPVDTEAIRAEDITLAQQWAAELGFDAIVSTDGDSDRPLLADHSGKWLRGDVLGVLCARWLQARHVVTPVSSNTLVEKCGSFAQVHRTRIGSPYVIAAMNMALGSDDGGIVAGYEANGGFLLASDVKQGVRRLSALPTRDAILPIVAALVAAKPGRLADLLAALPKCVTFSDRLQEFSPERRDALMSWLNGSKPSNRDIWLDTQFGPIAGATLVDVNLIDGVRMTFSNERVIHLRGSGNAPELRCYAEAETSEVAEDLSERTLALVRQRFPA
ncbi:MAG: phosphomannomutase [Novosphingobium sp.]|nr:phosphomannomutase [Novosphingobium sp.]